MKLLTSSLFLCWNGKVIVFTNFIFHLFFLTLHYILCVLIVWSIIWRVQFWFFFSFAGFDYDALFLFKVWTCFVFYLLFYFVYCFFFFIRFLCFDCLVLLLQWCAYVCVHLIWFQIVSLASWKTGLCVFMFNGLALEV
jgi:hypothetical protein